MKVNAPIIDEILSPLLPVFKKDNFTHQEVKENPPLRSELFSTEQMEQHAQWLAGFHVISVEKSSELLLRDLSENALILADVNDILKKCVLEKKSISPAADWLLDNFYLIEEQIILGKRYLPKGYSKGLPKLKSGLPRVYEIAIEIISHSDGHVDLQNLTRFIQAYQKESVLTLGELWAIPIMLRLALIENLSRVATITAVDRKDSALANKWANLIIECAEKNPKDLVMIIADMARSKPPMVSAFVAEFARKLQWRGPEFSLPISWIEQQLTGTDHTIASMVLIENQNQAADQVSVSNSINSLRFLSKMDWREFVESLSVVEQILQTDIHGVYSTMDFYTRDDYRHSLERMAKLSGLSEPAVAGIAIDLAQRSFKSNPTLLRHAHVGYYLRDEGVRELWQAIGVRLPLSERIKVKVADISSWLYLFSAVTITSGGTALMLWQASSQISMWWAVPIAFCFLVSASHLGLAISNWWATLWIKPKRLPKLDFSTGIPDQYCTMIVIPTLLVNQQQAEKLLEDLEVRFLANREDNLLFALLTDFRDAVTAITPADIDLVQLVQYGIESLNSKYGRTKNDCFFLFHRPRVFNEVDKIWMGYERKRGKLSDLNDLLRGQPKNSFSLIVGDEATYLTTKYIITLDTDTQLPREAAWQLVGLMAHPLNKPVYDEKKQRVTQGYTIIQPRVAISLHGATRSAYTRLHENDSGIDPYTRVTSDVYQDVFHEGSFIGKGIYEIDTFRKVLANRFPENRILSHDLLEGCYVRCGFASDVQLYEEYPTRYEYDISRRHRWIRGDWQIANWFLPFVQNGEKRIVKNSISALSRWKIFDNLRRSLEPLALLFLFLSGWLIFAQPLFWTLLSIAILFLPSFVSSLWSFFWKPNEVGVTQHISNSTVFTSKGITQVFFALACLPYEAFVSVNAISVTLWRVYVTGKKRLEWSPSAYKPQSNHGLGATYATMWISPLVAMSVFIFLLYTASNALFIALPFLMIWMIVPAIVHVISNPSTTSKSRISPSQRQYLREVARKTWSFFDDIVTEEDHWLPPDNLQEYPTPVIAHRTSPTNIGLYLLANLAANDFGYSSTTQLIERTVNTFTTLGKLDRFQGHFYNWYNTQTLQVLLPRYISTVDSGNLAGHLLTLRQGLLSLLNAKIIEPKYFSGLEDTLRIAILSLSVEQATTKASLLEFYDQISTSPAGLPAIKKHLDILLVHFRQITSSLHKTNNAQQQDWFLVFEKQLESIIDEVNLVAPWVTNTTIPERFTSWKMVDEVPTLKELVNMPDRLRLEFLELDMNELSKDESEWLHEFEQRVLEVSRSANNRMALIDDLASQCTDFADMEYGLLYDKAQHLLSIGYTVDDHQRDKGYYDLLASEARLGLFVAIAQGKLPQECWFALGRRLTTAGNTPVLLSWSGSMFEYLMPDLVMPVYDNTLLHEMGIGALKRQMEYGELHQIPWGISESCYNLVDTHLTYQYRAFGIPGLGFKRGLGQDLVIAPYASMLALMVDPKAACSNLENLAAQNNVGMYGFYEAIDYTPARLVRGQSKAVIQVFMAHHQGMSLLSLAYLLLDQPMQKRFEADTQFQTTLLLLQERVPRSTGFYVGSDDEKIIKPSITPEIRVINTPHTPIPEVQLLSNGRYSVMISNAGGGYSRWKDIAVTRWREDVTQDNWGTFCYIHDRDKKQFWSSSHQPTLKEADQYEVIFSQGRAEIRRRDGDIETYSVMIVSPEDDVEVRRIQLTNHSSVKRKLTVTSYGEVVLNAAAADEGHAAFSNLFVQTEIHEHQHAISCTRRPRSIEERPPWMFHLMKASGAKSSQVSYETDRSKFIGRGNTLQHPDIIDQILPLSGSQGSVLDPVFSIQYNVLLNAGESVFFDMVTGVAETREANQFLIDKYQDRQLRNRAFELSWTHSQVVLRQIGATQADAELYGKLASSILYLNPNLRPHASVLSKNQRGQSALWSYSISGDLPIVLLFVSDTDGMALVKQLCKAQSFWHMKGLAVDLIIINEDSSGYRQVLQEQIQGLIAAGIGIGNDEKKGHIVLRHIEQVIAEDRILLQTVARVVISDKKGTLHDQVNKRTINRVPIAHITLSKQHASINNPIKITAPLQFFNGSGGFSADGQEYLIVTNKNHPTPLPWINVIANQHFGTIISEKGSGYTWFKNAHGYRITPWKNDPILDDGGEAFYIRDEESGEYWSPMGFPSAGNSTYITKHGFGYTIIEHIEDGILSEVTTYVDLEAPVKFVSIKIVNNSGRKRKLTATGYVEWILGEHRSKTIMHVTAEWDPTNKAIIAKNPYNTEFQKFVAFMEVNDLNSTFTTDRAEFIGRNGSLQKPEVMERKHLSGRSVSGTDACGALQVTLELENNQDHTVIFKIGAGKDISEAIETINEFKGNIAAMASLDRVKLFWENTLNVIQVKTPDAAVNILSNGWLIYQVMSCRLWGRSGFYQSGGAFGFRDQLQDTLALLHAQPQLTRQQILLCASRQFIEGDVQHWWHPPHGRGVRTLCSDDYLWLPYVVARYTTTTGDMTVLTENVTYLEGRVLNQNEESYYDLPLKSNKESDIYNHCKQAIVHCFRFGEQGLPLMGSGDWNDGMNRVGIHGKGESVWLAFFLYDVIRQFMPLAIHYGDDAFVAICEKQSQQLKENINNHAWDGEWYLRGHFDDGTPLGSSKNSECKIDAISQSWSVLSNGGEIEKARMAMESLYTHLVKKDKGIIQLLDPPFDKSEMDPGYIKGYVPGVRENGGQYTHAAIWALMAFAKIEDHQRTEELLQFINPIHHGATAEAIGIYKVEPYVMAADVYGVAPHIGRGGWTWYTGSAGWMYQAIMYSYLGLQREGSKLILKPCVPASWKSFSLHYRFEETLYVIQIFQHDEIESNQLWIDGKRVDSSSVELVNDRTEHQIELHIGLLEPV